ncbi:alpha/beta fold hydrolase [Streptomyces sp. NPDC059389]|uniref:alpha/beta fold hydrolase n=1 Tax=Streptomyces sp. NPDC059389 TaxID=3346818 RepID=UPI0036A9B7EE
MLATVLGASAVLLATPAAGLLGHRALRRAGHARRLRIDGPGAVDEQGFVRIGGIEQWISIRGEDPANPVVLELHGGPGSSNSIFATRTRAWEEHFTLVRWDMRGAGKTFARSGPEGQGEMSMARMHQDAVEVTRYVRERLGVDQVVLLGQSFGSVFGLRLAREYPQWYSAYVGTDQNIHDAGRDTSVYEGLRARLRAAGKRRQLAALERMGPDSRRWTAGRRAAYSRMLATSDPLTAATMKSVVMGSLWFSPLHTLRELGGFAKAMKFSEQILADVATADDWADGTRFDLPFFIFQGDRDVITPAERARRFFDDVQAPVKEFALIGNSSHFACHRDPQRFLHLMLTRVHPVVTGARRPAGL